MTLDSHSVVQVVEDPSDLRTDPTAYLEQLAARVYDARAHWIVWSGSLCTSRSAMSISPETLTPVGQSTLCLAIGQPKPREQSWSDYFASGAGIPALWRKHALLAHLRAIEHALPTPFYLPYQIALAMNDHSLGRIARDGPTGLHLRAATLRARRNALPHILPVLRSSVRRDSARKSVDGTPAVSVALCAYNEADRIPWAIASVFAQSDSSWELLIVDDGSTDATAAAARSCTRGDSRVSLLQLPVNQGKAHALNRALSAARGRCLLELDADDWLPTDALERMRQMMDATPAHIGLLTFDHYVWRRARSGELHSRGMLPASRPVITSREARVPVPRLYRVSLLRQLGGWTTTDASAGRLFEDAALAWRLQRAGAVAIASGALYHRVIRGASVSQTHRAAYRTWAEQYLQTMEAHAQDRCWMTARSR